MKIFSKISTAPIIRDHFKTMVSYRTKKVAIKDIFLFFILPFIIAFALVYLRVQLSRNIINILITSFSIFAALLFNLLLILFDIIHDDRNYENADKIEAINEIHSNVSFCILISIVSISILLISSLDFQFVALIQNYRGVLTSILSTFVYFLVFLFIMTIFMVLKRVHILLQNQLKDKRQQIKK
jgi:hypothetical protein